MFRPNQTSPQSTPVPPLNRAEPSYTVDQYTYYSERDTRLTDLETLTIAGDYTLRLVNRAATTSHYASVYEMSLIESVRQKPRPKFLSRNMVTLVLQPLNEDRMIVNRWQTKLHIDEAGHIRRRGRWFTKHMNPKLGYILRENDPRPVTDPSLNYELPQTSL